MTTLKDRTPNLNLVLGTVSFTVCFAVWDNFFSAARYGLEAQLVWADGKTYSVTELLGRTCLDWLRRVSSKRALKPQTSTSI